MISLKQHLNTQHQLTALCESAVQQQIERGTAPATQLRQRRRHLLKALRKRIPKATRTPEKLLHTAVMVLALWGFGGIVSPNTAQAAAVFEHVMLEGFDVGSRAKPTFADIDGDGDLDAFVGGWLGTVQFYQNNGNASEPSFVAADGVTIINPLDGFDVGSSAAPTFVDIDNDGDLDAFVSDAGGTVMFYQNNGSASAPSFVAADGVTVINPLATFVMSGWPVITFADLDNDGDMDAFAGDMSGTVQFFQNNGNALAANFVAADGITVINPLDGFDVGTFSAPTFADIDNDGDLDAFVGENYGTVTFYRNTGTASAPVFTADAAGNPLAGFGVDTLPAPTFVDIDNDGDLDAFVGENDGTVKFYRNDGTAATPDFTIYSTNPLFAVDAGDNSAPVFTDIDNDGDLDLFVGEKYGTIIFYQNKGDASAANFVAADGVTVINPLAGFDVGYNAAPTFADIDDDGDLDAFVGESLGTVKFYRNIGTASAPTFTADAVGNPLATFDVGSYAKPSFADIDNDGDLDAFIGEQLSLLHFYRNNGTALSSAFVADAAGNPLAGIYPDFYAAVTFADIDNDGDLDAFMSGHSGAVDFIRNTGTALSPAFVIEANNPLGGFNAGSHSIYTFADIDSDGDLDVFAGGYNGRVQFFENSEFASDTGSTSGNGNSSSGGSSGGGGGAPGVPLLATLAALLAGLRRKRMT